MRTLSESLVQEGNDNRIGQDNERKDMPFKPSSNLSNQIARHISDQIIHANLKPGERIIEGKFGRELGVSQAPLREAMLLLEKDGLVEILPRRGVRVTSLTKAHVEDLYDILTELYTLLMRKLVEGITDESTRQIEIAINNLEWNAKVHDIEGYYHAIFELGATALQCVGMPLLNRIITEIWPSKRRVEYHITVMRRDELEQNAMLFRQAFQYALAGDEERAVQAVRKYTQGEKSFALAHVPFDAQLI